MQFRHLFRGIQREGMLQKKVLPTLFVSRNALTETQRQMLPSTALRPSLVGQRTETAVGVLHLARHILPAGHLLQITPHRHVVEQEQQQQQDAAVEHHPYIWRMLTSIICETNVSIYSPSGKGELLNDTRSMALP